MLYKCVVFAGQVDFLPNIVHFSNAGSMLGRRRRRWPNIKTALDECLAGVVSIILLSGYSYSAECNKNVGLLYIQKAYTLDLRMPILKVTVGLTFSYMFCKAVFWSELKIYFVS